MNVNLDKKKTLEFSCNTRKKDICITFQGKEIKNVKSYLGITFNHLGCFNEAKHNLYLKGLKGQFKLSVSLPTTSKCKKTRPNSALDLRRQKY